jgi:hypothetical protein
MLQLDTFMLTDLIFRLLLTILGKRAQVTSSGQTPVSLKHSYISIPSPFLPSVCFILTHL